MLSEYETVYHQHQEPVKTLARQETIQRLARTVGGDERSRWRRKIREIVEAIQKRGGRAKHSFLGDAFNLQRVNLRPGKIWPRKINKFHLFFTSSLGLVHHSRCRSTSNCSLGLTRTTPRRRAPASAPQFDRIRFFDPFRIWPNELAEWPGFDTVQARHVLAILRARSSKPEGI